MKNSLLASPSSGINGWVNPPNLIDQLLAEQRVMTAVSEFSSWHDQHQEPSLKKYYEKLIPLEKPQPGEQFAFEVNLDTCSGCKSCVSACHSLNGLDLNETWRDVGTLIGNNFESRQITVTAACHHCAEPACMHGCPVMAYEKDAETGIVRHLDDQCIGCQYCVLKCPYDVPKYHEEKGIVRKCDMCYSRLSVGEAPACVQACPNEAIKIVKTTLVEMKKTAQEIGALVPGAFDSNYTLPSSRYVSAENISAKTHQPADAYVIKPECGHTPLVGMLVMTQLSAGLFLAMAAHAFIWPGTFVHAPLSAVTAILILLAGIGLSVGHLGQPLKAWRAFLGWRKSWLSREIIAFGGFANGAIAYTALICLPQETRSLVENFTTVSIALIRMATLLFVAFMGLASVFCSIMVYADTRRILWKFHKTTARFAGTMIGAGGLIYSLMLMSSGPADVIFAVTVTSLVALALKMAFESIPWFYLKLEQVHEDERSVKLMSGVLWPMARARWFASILGMMLVLLATLAGNMYGSILASILILTGEVMERKLFFHSVQAHRMPGSLRV